MKDFDLRVISLGAGVQSSTMYRMAALGEFDVVPDYAVFADTQAEPPWVYEMLDLLERDHGDVIPIVRATAGSLGDAVRRASKPDAPRFASVPFWVEGGDGRSAPGRRQCTREYKINVVQRAVRAKLGLKKGERAAGRFQVEEWIGISTDEASRAKPARYPWVTTRWPLLYDEPMSRSDCKQWSADRGFAVPQKSSCTFCPYRQPAEYARWREEEPALWEEACQFDEMLRARGPLRGTRAEQYVWRELRPLRDLPPLAELDGRDQLELFDFECEGMCGV